MEQRLVLAEQRLKGGNYEKDNYFNFINMRVVRGGGCVWERATDCGDSGRKHRVRIVNW